jgi:hypothetical protein
MSAWNATLPRWYVRCPECLSIGCIDSPERPPQWRSDYKRDENGKPLPPTAPGQYPMEWVGGLTCDACGGHVETMGQVTWTKRRLFENEQESVCDGRCTGAKGWKCDCSCGGHNHGTGATVTVQRDKGGIPRLLVLKPAEAKARRAAWDAAWDRTSNAFDAAFGAIRARKARRDWLDAPQWDDFLLSERLRDDMKDAAGMRTHKGRMDKLARVLEACAAVRS